MLTTLVGLARRAIVTAAETVGDLAAAASNLVLDPAPIAEPKASTPQPATTPTPAAAAPAPAPAPAAIDPETETDDERDQRIQAERAQGAAHFMLARKYAALGRRYEKLGRAAMGDTDDGEQIGEYVVSMTDNEDICDTEAMKQILREQGIAVPMKPKSPTMRLVKISEAAPAAEPIEPPVVQDPLPEPAPEPVSPEVIAAARANLPAPRAARVADSLRSLAAGLSVLPDPSDDPEGFWTAFTAAHEAAAAPHTSGRESAATLVREGRTAIRTASRTAGIPMRNADSYEQLLRDGTTFDLDRLHQTVTEAAQILDGRTPAAA